MNKHINENEDHMNFKVMFDLIWLKRVQVVLITLMFSLFFIFYSLSIENTYISGSVLKVNSENRSSLSEYAGLASMAGIELGGGRGEKNSIEDIEAVLTSKGFVKHLIQFEDVMLNIMAAKSFDVMNQQLIYDEKKYNTELKEWVRDIDFPFKPKPSALEVHEDYLDKIVSIRLEEKAQFVYLSVEHVSPIFAKEFLELIIEELNMIMRQRDLEESSNALKYLKDQISETPQIEIRNTINEMVRTQLQTQMTAKINKDYVLTALDPPYLPLEKSNPKRSLIVIIGTILGFFSSLAWVTFYNFLYRKEA